jgi:hypothetical protein
MAVRPIQQHDHTSSNFSNVIAATTGGALAGYGAKWLYPVTKQEQADPLYREGMALLREKANTEFVNSVRNLSKKTKAQDVFIKTVDGIGGLTENSIKSLSGDDAAELRGLFTKLTDAAGTKFEIYSKELNLWTKKIRPASWFIAAGALAGFALGVTHNVLKTDVKA